MRYPSKFEMFRLEALGEAAYLEIDDARRRYESGKSIRVIPEAEPVTWFLLVAPQKHRFTITFYTASGTPLRTATWEQEEGLLLCRRTIDMFYPDGDPGMTVPSSEVVSVTQQISADGVVGVTLSSPIDDDQYREAIGASVADFHAALPQFGEWQPLLEASSPVPFERFGLDSIDAAIAYADQCVAQGTERADVSLGESWRVHSGDRDIMGAVDEIIEGGNAVVGIPVIERGALRIVPLAAQSSPLTSGRDPREESRRMDVLADEIRDACEQRAGRGITLDLHHRGADLIASYASALRASGTTNAQWWEFGQKHGVVLVWTGDAAQGTLSLALHIVPVSWVSARQTGPAGSEIDASWSRSGIPGSSSDAAGG